MSLYYCWVTKMANAVVLWVLVYFCVTSVNTKDRYFRNTWYDMFKCLEWSEDANAVFCHQCMQAYISDCQMSTSNCKLELVFLVNG